MKPDKIKNFLILVILVSAGLGTSLSSFGNSLSACLGQPLSKQEKYLSCLRDSKMAHGIRTVFDKALKNRRECKKCADFFPRVSNFAPLLGLQFIVLTLDDAPFGGYSTHIIFKESPKHMYRIWLYPIDENEFQVREFITVTPSEETLQLMANLAKSGYSKYGL